MTPFSQFVVDTLKRDNLVGVEVGVRDGLNAGYLMDSLSLKHLFLIDHFPPYNDYNRRFWDENEQLIEFKKLIKLIQSDPKYLKGILIHKPSSVARILLNDMQFDFVYIDADHKYEFVKDDLNWWDLVKTGGILGGHDYGTVDGDGVLKAVDEFAKEKGIEVHPLDVSRGGKEWALIKP